jgi:nitrogen fixation protein NifU and related proteins
MMSELESLYQDVILDHNKSPYNFKKLENANRHAEGYNPLCGDHYDVYLRVEGDVIQEVSFVGAGCAISKASASVMSSLLKGKTIDEARELIDVFQKLVTGEVDPIDEIDRLGKLAAFSGVSEFPARVKCASLAWHTLRAALEDKQKTVSTENKDIFL